MRLDGREILCYCELLHCGSVDVGIVVDIVLEAFYVEKLVRLKEEAKQRESLIV